MALKSIKFNKLIINLILINITRSDQKNYFSIIPLEYRKLSPTGW